MFDKNEIIEMARQAGFEDSRNWTLTSMPWLCESLEVFAKLVAAKEREACAKICDRKYEAWKKAGLWNQSFEYKERAEAIRARGEA